MSVGRSANQNLPSFQRKQIATNEIVGGSEVCRLAYFTNPRRPLIHAACEEKRGVDLSVKYDEGDIRSRGYEAQLHLEMDVESYAGLKWIQGALEAASIGEVIRRAILALEFDRSIGSVRVQKGSLSVIGQKAKRLHVRVPLRTKDRLDKLKEETDGTYSDIINQSLHVLAQFVRDREAITKGEGYAWRRKQRKRKTKEEESDSHVVSRQVGSALC